MPSILNDEDKDTVKRFVPKQSNKIQAVAVARLYVSYPNSLKWTYTGLQGAIVLANDLVGNTYWLKMVDISVRRPLHKPALHKAPGRLTIHGTHSPRDAASSGTRRSLIHGATTRTGPSFTPLSWRNALRGSASSTRRRRSSSRRRWTIARRTRAEQPDPHPLAEHHSPCPSTACWAASSTATRRPPRRPRPARPILARRR